MVNSRLEYLEDVQSSPGDFAFSSPQQPLPSGLPETVVPSLLTIDREAPHLVSTVAPPNGPADCQEQAGIVRNMDDGHPLLAPSSVLAHTAAIALDRVANQQQPLALVNHKTDLVAPGLSIVVGDQDG